MIHPSKLVLALLSACFLAGCGNDDSTVETDAERMGLDFLFHLGRGIPFYILIDKYGVIVDYGNHLRPSSPITRERIDQYLGQQPSE